MQFLVQVKLDYNIYKLLKYINFLNMQDNKR